MRSTAKILSVVGLLMGVVAACENDSGPMGPALADPGADLATSVFLEGVVETADAAEATFMLRGGATVRVDGAATIEGDASSLTEVSAALETGATVRAAARVVSSGGSLTASAVRFEFDASADGGTTEASIEFEGRVEAASEASGTLTLSGDVTVRVTGETTIDASGDARTLAEVESALAADAMVRAEGRAVVRGASLTALRVELEIEAAASGETGFSGTVDAIDVVRGTLTLTDGTRIELVSSSEISFEGALTSLADVAAVVATGSNVTARGEGALRDGVVIASSIEFAARSVVGIGGDDEESDDDGSGAEAGEAVVEFAGTVRSMAGGLVTLTSGTVVRLEAGTDVDFAGAVTSVTAVTLALAAGTTIEATGEGVERNGVIVASSIVFGSEGSLELGDRGATEGS